MCGIAGYISKSRYPLSIIEKCLDTLIHRGPDDFGVNKWECQDFEIAFGHRRLSIIDLSENANQPMHYDGLNIVFNGEIYNYQEIKDELIIKGHSFMTSSDTEVILHSIREWGTNAISKWHGMFSIVLFDEKFKTITAIRDRAGVKPFFYYHINNVFIFGSELKAIVSHPEFKKNININSLSSFFQFGYISWPSTIWNSTYKLPPGNFLNFNLKTGEITTTQYWNVYDSYLKPKCTLNFKEAFLETEKVLTKAINYRMVSDVPVGVFLSGGYDSTCVTALLQKDRTDKIKTFTIGIENSKLNEAPFAKNIAKYIGTDHTEYYCTAKEVLNIIPKLPVYYDEPFADSSCIPTILVSRLARNKVTVALSADAGDEIFAGYDRYLNLVRYYEKINKIPSPIRALSSGIMSLFQPENILHFGNKSEFVNKYKKLENQLKDHSLQNMMYNLSYIFTKKDIKDLFSNQVEDIITPHCSQELINKGSTLEYLMAIDYQTYLSDDILQKVDRASMSCGLEGREPFLDHSVIEWAAQLPTDYKYYKGERKYILKKIVHKYVPNELMCKKKMGFSIPISKWLFTELKELVSFYLSNEMLQKHGLFNNLFIKKLLNDFYNGKEGNYLKLWHILIFQMWYEKWMINDLGS